MELRHIYNIASSIKQGLDEFSEQDDVLRDLVVSVSVAPPTHYAIDKEFYRLTHGDTNDFVHNEKLIDANIDGVRFLINNKVNVNGESNKKP